MDSKKAIAAICLVMLVALGLWLVVSNRDADDKPDAPTEQVSATPSQGMYAEENALVTSDQKPGGSVTISKVLLSQPGYVVIHVDHSEVGQVIGSSALLAAGEHDNVRIELGRASKNGEILYAMLHAEQDGNAVFEASSDLHVQSKLGGPIQSQILIDADASGDPPVTL